MKALLLQGKHLVRSMALAAVTACLCMLTIATTQAAPVDDSRVMMLEQEVRGLQRLVDQQARRIDSLESAMRQSRPGRAIPTPAPVPTPATAAAETTSLWLKSANWDKLRPGMSEREVLELLGPPTTSRKAGQGQSATEKQTLFYAMELEAGGFLSGHVIVSDHRVVEVHKPTLK